MAEDPHPNLLPRGEGTIARVAGALDHQYRMANGDQRTSHPDNPIRFPKTKANGRTPVRSPAAVNYQVYALESLLQPNVPEPAFDRGKRFIVAVFKGAAHKWRIFVGDVLQPKRDGRAI